MRKKAPASKLDEFLSFPRKERRKWQRRKSNRGRTTKVESFRKAKAKENGMGCTFTHMWIPKITSAKIQEMHGFTKQQVRIVIDKMRNEELLDICKRGNKSYYVKF